MESAKHQILSNKIKILPDFLADELSDFIDFLIFKKEKDWATTLSEDERKSIEKGLKDIEEGNVFFHESVMDDLAEYRKNKNK